MIKIKDKSKNKLYSSNMELIDKFTDYSSKNLDFDKPVTIEFLDDERNAKNPLGMTAYYSPDEMKIVVYVTGRHLKDILRSISHELIHHVQKCRGDLDHSEDTGVGYAQRDDHMRDMEQEAYTKGNIMNFRDFEDNYKLRGRPMKSNLKENRLKKLNDLLMNEQAKAFVDPPAEEKEDESGFDVTTGISTGAGSLTLLSAAVGYFKDNPDKLAKRMRKLGASEKVIKDTLESLGKDLKSPSRMRRALRFIKSPFSSIMKAGGEGAKATLRGMGDFAKSLATQQKYFGVGSKYIVDKNLGTVIKKMGPEQIAKAVEKKVATKQVQRIAQRAGREAIKRAEREAVEAILKNNAKKAGEKAAKSAIEAAMEKGVKSPKVLDSFGRKAALKAEKEIIEKGLSKSAEKAARLAAKEGAELAGKRATDVALRLAAYEAEEEIVKRGGQRITGNVAKQILKRAGTSGFAVGGKLTVKAALGGAMSVYTAAEVGAMIGAGINKLMNAAFGEELKEIMTMANADQNYAIAEMDAYCTGKGALCRKISNCEGQKSGYEYGASESDGEAIESLALIGGSGLPKDSSRDKTFFTRKYIKSPAGRWHAKDGATMVGVMGALFNHDVEAGRIVKDGEGFKVNDNALVKKYKDCFVSVVGAPIVLQRIANAGLGDTFKAIASLFAETKNIKMPEITPIGANWPDSKFTAGKVKSVADLFYLGLEGIGTDEDKLEIAFKQLEKLGPLFTLQVEKYFGEKYQNFDPDGLVDALMDDLSGDAEEKAVSYFEKAREIVAQRQKTAEKEKTAAATAVAKGKCGKGGKGFPVNRGCEGQQVSNFLAVLLRGTEAGKSIFNTEEGKQKANELYNRAIFDDETIEFMVSILNKAGEADLAKYLSGIQSVEGQQDRFYSYLLKTAREQNISENKIQKDESLLHINNKRNVLLNKKLMEQIK